MADPKQYQFLLEALAGETGRKLWLAFKEKARWVDLSTANFSELKLDGYDLSEVNLSAAIFLGANLAGTDLSDASLAYADLRRANLRNAVLDRADLHAANLQGAALADACLEGANLRQAKLAGANLVGADLSGVDLSEADLRGAKLKYSRLSGAKLSGANVAEADLTGAILDDEAPLRLRNFDLAVIDDRKYREMRSRLTNLSQLPVLDAAKSGKPNGKANGASGKKTHKPATERFDPTDDAPTAGARAESGWIPVREKEPDLTTVAGCCQVLEVPTGATLDEIVKAFRKKAKVYHPDKVRHLSANLQELAAQEFRRLRTAYEALTRSTARPLVGINWPEAMPRHASPYDYSIAEYEQLARLNPANTNILYNLAWKYFEDSRFPEALAGFMRVVTLNPKDEDAQYNIIIVRLYSEILLPGIGADAGK